MLDERLSNLQPSTFNLPTFQPSTIMPTPPYEKLTLLENFGHSLRAQSYVYKPTSVDEIADVFKIAKHNGLKVTARGAGRSYNDASLNGGSIVMDLSAMNK